MARLAQRVREFTDALRRDYGREIHRNPRAFKHQVVRLVRLGLPPGPGRPPDEAITRAIQLRERGTPWLEVYRKCIPNFADLGDGDRQLAMTRFRSAVRSRTHQRKPRKSRPHFQRQEIHA